jgi:precorrin-6Y C5,15-methyltransferase (decarboxylating)
MSGPWLSVIGVGDDGLAGLTSEARAALDAAEVIFGGKRHLAALADDRRTRVAWSSPFHKSVDAVLGYNGQKVAVLASGDPMWFGVGATLSRHVPNDEMRIYPAPSAFSLAAAKLGWSLGEVECLSAHGRVLENIIPFVTPRARLFVLCRNGETPRAVADLLNARGFGDSRVVALSHLGGENEALVEGLAMDWPDDVFPNLTVLALDCVAGSDALVLATVPGLPDDAFSHDGQLTKREVRAASVAALAPLPGQRLWDAAIAIEKDEARRSLIARNAAALGTPGVEIIAGQAPGVLAGLDAPDAVFIGGGLSAEGIVETCWQALGPRGRLVANAVTIEGESRLVEAHSRYGGELLRIAISRADAVGSFQSLRPLMPVTQWRIGKK